MMNIQGFKSDTKDDDFARHIDVSRICRLGEKIIRMGCALLLIKCGEKGVYFKASNEKRVAGMGKGISGKKTKLANKELFRETFVVRDFKSALGAGDTTTAGFIAGLMNGYAIEDCLKIACKTGALCCTTLDVISRIEPISQIYQMVISDDERNTYAALDKHFDFNHKTQVWERKEQS